MNTKYQVPIAVTVASFAAVEVEAVSEIEANRIVAESIERDKWESPYWQEAHDWDTDWQNAEDLRVVGWEPNHPQNPQSRLKRDNWTNDEVIDILKGLRLVDRGGKELSDESGGDWNAALNVAMSQFSEFKRDAREYAAMAYDPETKEILVVGPPLPR